MLEDGRKMRSGPLHMVTDSCEDTRAPPPQGQWSEEDVFVSRAATDVTTHVQYTHPDRANQAACGTNVADDKWDKALPSDDS